MLSFTLPDIIIRVEFTQLPQPAELLDYIFGHPALQRHLHDDNHPPNRENFLPGLIESYLKKTFFRIEESKFRSSYLELIENETDREFFAHCYPDNGDKNHILAEHLADDREAREKFFSIRIRNCLEPLIIKSGDQRYACYLIVETDALTTECDTASLVKLCNAINQQLEEGGAPAGDGNLLLKHVAPNMLIEKGQPNSLIDGGPAAWPVRLDDELLTRLNACASTDQIRKEIGFSALAESLKSRLEAEPVPGRNVDIYVLDSLPARLDQFDPENNPLLSELKIKQNMQRYQNCFTRQDFNAPASGEKDNSDHGLFIAGIIRMLSPHSKIHLVEVLNRQVTGDLRSLLWGIARTISLLDGNSRGYCVINCSFTVKKPVNEINPAVKMVEFLFDELKESVGKHGLIVCAAGNDCSQEDLTVQQQIYNMKQTVMLPAGIADIYGIGALSSLETDKAMIAPYSLVADIEEGEGFWALGGDLDPEVSQLSSRKGNSLVSLYSCSEYPESEENTSGWARACGTSFAAAVATGTFAALLATDQTRDRAAVTESVRKFLKDIVREKFSPENNKIADTNVIPVTQKKTGTVITPNTPDQNKLAANTPDPGRTILA